jgi:GNAT superfamily N-acetyltransferase
MHMEIRPWQRPDLAWMGSLWLEAYEDVRLAAMPLHPNAGERLGEWLRDRFRDRGGLGCVAEVEGQRAGFLVGRVGEWGTDPPILAPRRIGLIDVVFVVEGHRRMGVGTSLVRRAVGDMEARGVSRLETNFELDQDAASSLWRKSGFVPWIARAYRITGGS